MKKILLFLIAFSPIFVFANTCENVIDTQTNNDRVITCDDDMQTITTFKTTNEVTALSNGVCEIKCSEELIFSVDPIKKVLAGTSFNYPLYTSGVRKCTAKYDYVTYETTIKKLVSEYESLTGTAKTTKGNEIVNYYDKKKSCDEFTKSGSDYEKKYKVSGDVTLKVATSTAVDNIKYSYKEIGDYNSVVDTVEERYASCNYSETTRKCAGSTKTISGWTETAKIFGKFTMPNSYIEKYTGEVKSKPATNTCNAGDRYFTPFNELTKPTRSAVKDKGYTLTLNGVDIGNNISSVAPRWNLTVNCFYQVKNFAFPQGGSNTVTSGNEDENYDEYGNNAFIYRQISLSDPFPDRNPNANWYGKENIILSTKDDINNMSKFQINLNRSSIKQVREYNENYKYDTFNLDEMEKSLFIIKNTSIVERK